MTRAQCERERDRFRDDGAFRSTIDMARYRFGEGCYRYYAYPLPPAVAALRGVAVQHLSRRHPPVPHAAERRGPAPDDRP